MKATPTDRFLKYEKWFRQSGLRKCPQYVRNYFGAKIQIDIYKSICAKERPRLRRMMDGLEELSEKSREKRQKKIAETESRLLDYEKALEKCKAVYNKVEKQAREKLVEMAKNMVDRVGGEGCFDNMVRLRDKRIKGEKIPEKKRQEYKELDFAIKERLVWAAEILRETEDNPF